MTKLKIIPGPGSIPEGTRVVISPKARFWDPGSYQSYPIYFTPTVHNTYWIDSVDGNNYLIRGSDGASSLVYWSYVSIYKEEKEIPVKIYEKTYESFVEWAKENDLAYTVYAFEEAVRESNPNAGEVWLVKYYNTLTYLRRGKDNNWYEADGNIVSVSNPQVNLQPVKRIGTDEELIEFS